MNRGVIFGLASAVLFGLSTPLAKLLVGSVPPLLLAGLLYAGAGAGMAMLLVLRRLVTARPLSLPAPGEWRWLTGAVVLGGVLGPVALMYGLTTTPATSASLLLNLEPVFTALLAWYLFKENFDTRIAIGMAAIVAGGFVLAWAPMQSGHSFPGPLLIGLACLCWGLDNNLTRKVSTSDAFGIAALKGVVAGTVNTGLALALGHAFPPLPIAGAAAAVGFLGYGVSLMLFVLALRHLGTARAGAYFAIAPFFGAALALLLQGDAITWQLVSAGALMALGVWLHLTEHHGHQHTHEPIEHSHVHSHDDLHHTHEHPEGVTAGRHVHAHRHIAISHSHPHYPDAHHRHKH